MTRTHGIRSGAVTPPVTHQPPESPTPRRKSRCPKITTARSVDTLQPKATRYIVRDTEVSGLELRIAPNGTKTWTLRFRNRAGEQRRLKLGVYGPNRMTLAKAREAANLELRKVDTGTDPQAERQAVREAAERAKQDSIEALCEAYIEQWAKPRKRTWRDDQSKINRVILPRWKGRAVSSITRLDCCDLIQAIADRGKGTYANRIGALLSKMFRFAVRQNRIPVNPATDLPKPGVEAHNRPEGEVAQKPYDDAEIRAIWKATEDLPAAVRAIYRLGLVTGQRPGEIAGMERAELAGEWWTIPARRSKNRKAHRVFLTALALDEIARVPEIVDEPKVFAGWRGKRQLAAINVQVFAKVRERAKPRHAMRDTVATGLAAAGVTSEHIARVLNHAYGPPVTAVYNAHTYDPEKKRALTRWGKRLTAILEGTSDAKVVSISTRTA